MISERYTMHCTLRNHIFLVLIFVLLFRSELHSQSPGGVLSSPLKLWFKADTGVVRIVGQVNKWNDVSNAGNVITQPQKSTNVHVTYQTSAANFNPTVLFDGLSLEQL